MHRRLIVTLLAAGAGIAFASPAQAADPAVTCAALGQADFARTPDAPAQILEAAYVAASGDQPGLCRISGIVKSDTTFELHLPVDRWNGKLLQAGCAGFCGRTMAWYCRDATARGYACIVSDMGHRSAMEGPAAPSLSALWADGNDSAQIDHGFRSSHATTVIGKAIVAGFYGKPANRAYFNGCSEGGREALIAAQRFPWDFDGIIAGAPAMDVGRTFLSGIWNDRALHGPDGKPLFTPANLSFAREAVMKACDGNDGIIDEVIGDPRQCRFDPMTLICKEDSAGSCLTQPQAQALMALIGGPRTRSGTSIAPGLSPAVWWGRLLAPGTAGRSVAATYGEEFFRYLGFSPAPGGNWKAADFDFETDYRRTGVADALLSATNPDLRRFRDAGGKLILYHGWDDHLIAPQITVDYYEVTRAAMGGQAATDSFFRLYMVPGMDHCALGGGAWAVDYLTYLEDWVEKGQAPDRLIATRPRLPADPVQAFARIGRYPVPADEVEFTRPLYPYPQRYRYDGHGDTSQAASYRPTR
jgi:feruloyl esterase